MRSPLIDRVVTVSVSCATRTGDDTVFVAVQGVGQTGWYGPVSTSVGRAVETITPLVEGAALFDHQGLRPRLRAASPGVSDWAVGAIDCAAWDLHGRLAARPVADLLVPRWTPRAVPAYASWLRLDIRSSAGQGALAQVLDEGWTLTKWGLRRRPGTSSAAEAEDLVSALGPASAVIGGPFAVDAVGTWTPQLAAAFAALIDHSSLTWLEDPLPRHQLSVYSRLSSAGMPVAVGERLRPEEDVGTLLRLARPAALTIDVVGCGGLTRAVEITKRAHQAGVLVYPHGRSIVPGIHLAAAFPEAVGAVEYRRQWEPRRQLIYAEPWIPKNGTLSAPEAPGLGTLPRSI